MRMKITRGWTKHVLRRALSGRLPESILWRRDKRGFSTPEARLLRNELRGHVDELLDSNSEMVRRGLVNLRAARGRFAAFLRDESTLGQRVASREIFQLLSLEMWLRSFRESLSG
jgi:asparagine synthase (glutamine-hydrolysing)